MAWNCELTTEDLNKVISALPLAVSIWLKNYKCLLAGGAVVDILDGKTPRDFDIYCETPGHRAPLTTMDIISLSQSAMAFTSNTFDFTICSAGVAYIHDAWISACHPNFYEDFKERKLRFAEPQKYYLEKLKFSRVVKWMKKGYSLDVKQLIGKYNEISTPPPSSEIEFTSQQFQTTAEPAAIFIPSSPERVQRWSRITSGGTT